MTDNAETKRFKKAMSAATDYSPGPRHLQQAEALAKAWRNIFKPAFITPGAGRDSVVVDYGDMETRVLSQQEKDTGSK